MDVKPGDVLLVRTTGVFGSLIRFGEARRYGKPNGRHSPAWWNHAALAVDTKGGIIEAQAHGTAAAYLATKVDWADCAVLSPPYAPGGADAAVAAMRDLIGDPYDWAAIGSEALALMTGLRLRFGLAGTEICSGAVGYALTRAGLNIGPEPEWLTPADLYAIGSHWPCKFV